MRQLDAQDERVETGGIKFGEDWPGLFVRGDEAMGIVVAVKYLSNFFEAIPREEYNKNENLLELLSKLNKLQEIKDIIMNDVIVRS